MKVCIVGSRSITDAQFVFQVIDRFIKDQCVAPVVLLSGGAKGVDSLVKEYAAKRGIDFVEFVPYHVADRTADFRKRYFFIRNKQMIENADKVLAIWDGESSGTEHTISLAQKHNVPVMVIKTNPA